MSKQRDQALRALCADIQAITDGEIEATWKDADPAHWRSMSPQIAQHRHHYCMAIKDDAERCRRCNQHCNHPRTSDDRPRLVTCPFGVTEMRIPLIIGGNYHGTLSLSPWRGSSKAKLPAALGTAQQQLTRRNDKQARALARMIEARLLQIFLTSDTGQHKTEHNPKDQQRLDACLNYIEAHLHLQLRAATVASVIGLSTSRFIHWFKDCTGISYRSHVQQAVLKKAAQLLAHSRSSITGITYDLGYHSPSAFAAAFKKQYGIQPSQFRNSVRERI